MVVSYISLKLYVVCFSNERFNYYFFYIYIYNLYYIILTDLKNVQEDLSAFMVLNINFNSNFQI